MELVEVGLVVFGFVVFVIVDTWYYRVHRPRRRAREDAVAHLAWALEQVHAGNGAVVDTPTLEALLGVLEAERRRRGIGPDSV